MNWDTIERKWEEMARRVQPLSSRQAVGRSRPARNDAAMSAPMSASDSAPRATASKHAE